MFIIRAFDLIFFFVMPTFSQNTFQCFQYYYLLFQMFYSHCKSFLNYHGSIQYFFRTNLFLDHHFFNNCNWFYFFYFVAKIKSPILTDFCGFNIYTIFYFNFVLYQTSVVLYHIQFCFIQFIYNKWIFLFLLNKLYLKIKRKYLIFKLLYIILYIFFILSSLIVF